MKINLSPVRCDEQLEYSLNGDTLIVNEISYDFSNLPEGGILPREAVDCDFITSDITRNDGEIELTIKLFHSANASESARFPQPIINPADGKLELPK